MRIIADFNLFVHFYEKVQGQYLRLKRPFDFFTCHYCDLTTIECSDIVKYIH
jgi:hypothetical protein